MKTPIDTSVDDISVTITNPENGVAAKYAPVIRDENGNLKSHMILSMLKQPNAEVKLPLSIVIELISNSIRKSRRLKARNRRIARLEAEVASLQEELAASKKSYHDRDEEIKALRVGNAQLEDDLAAAKLAAAIQKAKVRQVNSAQLRDNLDQVQSQAGRFD